MFQVNFFSIFCSHNSLAKKKVISVLTVASASVFEGYFMSRRIRNDTKRLMNDEGSRYSTFDKNGNRFRGVCKKNCKKFLWPGRVRGWKVLENRIFYSNPTKEHTKNDQILCCFLSVKRVITVCPISFLSFLTTLNLDFSFLVIDRVLFF